MRPLNLVPLDERPERAKVLTVASRALPPVTRYALRGSCAENPEEAGRRAGQAAAREILKAIVALPEEDSPQNRVGPGSCRPAGIPGPSSDASTGGGSAETSTNGRALPSSEISNKLEGEGGLHGLHAPRALNATGKAEEGAPEDTQVDFGEWKVSARRLEARRRERVARMTSWERTAQASLKRLFARQRRVTVEKLKGAKSRQLWFSERDGEHYATKEVDVDVIFDRTTWNDQLAEDGRAWIEATMEDFGGEVVDTLNGTAKAVEVTFDIEDPEVQRLIEEQVNRLVGVNDTTYDAIKATLAEGVGQGESISKLAKRIEAVFSEATRVRSEMIARTEVLSAANASALQAAKGAGIEGISKVWLSASDKRTRDDHRNANGQEKGMDEPFIVGGHPMQHPGDPAAPAEQTIRCRCSLIMSTPESLLL